MSSEPGYIIDLRKLYSLIYRKDLGIKGQFLLDRSRVHLIDVDCC